MLWGTSQKTRVNFIGFNTTLKHDVTSIDRLLRCRLLTGDGYNNTNGTHKLQRDAIL